MLSIKAIENDGIGYCVNLAREDYYFAGGEPEGVWIGDGAKALGLSGKVERNVLRNLFQGYSLDGTQALVRNAGYENRQPGWDLSLGLPKSVSTAWALSPRDLQKKIEACGETAVARTIGYLQDTAAFSRVGKGGHELLKAGLVIATFQHATSRELEPQLHWHLLVVNTGVRPNGTTGTLVSRELYRAKMAAGALFRCELAAGLEKLGFQIERYRSWFEIKGVPQDLMDRFSTRSKQITEALARRNDSSAQAAAKAAVDTRRVKDKVPPRHELFQDWQKVGCQYGFGPEKVQGILRHKIPERETQKEIAEAISIATKRLADKESHWSERQFVRAVAEEAQGRGLGADTVRQATRHHLQNSPEIICLGRLRDEARFTTKEIFDQEKKMLSRVDQIRVDQSHVVSEKTLQKVLSKASSHSEEQTAALRQLTAETGALAVLAGMAGSGKTKLLETAREAWEREGYRVIGCALAGKAADGLQDGAGIMSYTVDKLLKDLDRGVRHDATHHAKQLVRAALGKKTYAPDRLKLSNKDILVVDEASMVGTQQMASLLTHAESVGCKVVLVGDQRQLQAIERGGAFKEIGEHVGTASLTTIVRQRDQWAREAVHAFASGDARDGLKAYAEKGLVHVGENRSEAMRELVSHWETGGIKKPQDHLIIASTNAECHELNRMAQEERRKSGEFTGFRARIDSKHFYLGTPQVERDGQILYEGDRILFERNNRYYGVKNGQLGTIERIDQARKTITVRLDRMEKGLLFDSHRRVTLSYRHYTDFSLGYAVSTHRAQGITVENAYVLAGGAMQHRELSYVQASRARGTTRFFTDKFEAGKELTDLARQMSQSREKTLAHSVLLHDQRRVHELTQEIGR